MTISRRIKQLVCESILFPLSNSLMNRKGIMNLYRKSLKTQKVPQDLIQEIQLQKLKNVIQYANTYIPFYKRRFASIGLQPGDIKCLKDIEYIPPLTREDVIDNHRQLVDVRNQESIASAENSTNGPGEPISFARFIKHKFMKNTSNGSTGSPTIFYENGAITALNWVQELRFRKWYKVRPGAKEARLARISTDFMPNNTKVLLREILWNQLLLPGVNLSEFDNRTNYHKISYFKPEVLWGSTSSLTHLAEYMQNNNLKFSTWEPKVCITWAAPLYDHEKDLLERVFHCPITNIYGAREVGHIAGVCPHGSMHINQDTLYVETEKNNEELSGVDDGELLVTTLEQTPMPFIRYRMGDIGTIAESKCSCGINLQVLKNLHGRTEEIFITRDGRMISPKFWCRTFMNKKLAGAIKRFQVRYTKKGDIKIKLVRHNTYTSKTEHTLKKFLKENFHSDINISFDFTEKIKPQVSGKYEMVVHE